MPKLDRRSLLATGALGAASLAGSGPAQAGGKGALAVVGLCTSGRVDPIGIDDLQPTLGWRIEGPAGTMQVAYRILVASSPKRLAAGQGDLWDSGRIESDASTGIRYAGAALSSGQACHWRVEAWDSRGHRAQSAPAFWEIGLPAPSDWSGDWLAVESATERDDRLADPEWVIGAAPSPQDPRSFRLAFTSAEGPALLTLVADGVLSDVALDGKPLILPARDPNAFGGAPASRFEIDLAAGAHVLSARLAPTPGFFVKPVVMIAGQVRCASPAGGTARIAQGWETRMDDGEAWQAAQRAPSQPNFPWPPSPARLLRREFDRAARPVRARLHVAALGGYRAWINGTRVGADELQAEPANYARRIPYRSYDVTGLVAKGRNAIGLLVGDGHFASYQAPDGRFAFLPAPRRVRAVLEITDGAGKVERIVCDGTWKHAPSHLTLSEIYAGEDQDLRLWPEGWTRPGFDDAGWDKTWTAPAPGVPTTASLAEPVRIVRRLPPLLVRKLAPARHIVDFGQNFAGRVSLRVKGAAGQEIVVSHAEILDAKGELDRRNLRAARAEDRYVLAGRAEGEDLCPVLTYQGFRYAEISGIEALDPAAITGLVLSSDLAETGTLRIDNPRIQKLWLNTLWSQRANFMGIPTDCPQRDERLGWTGDAQVFWDTASFNADTGAFSRAFCRDLRDAQGANGAYPLWAPNPHGLGWGTPSATPGWADAGVMLPYVALLHGGDRAIVDENWAAMTAYIEGILATNPDGLWANDRGADLGDWLALDAKFPMDETTPKALIASAMLARSQGQMAQMAQWTGRDEEAARWRASRDRTVRAFRAAFVKDDGTVGNASQCSYILALALGLLDDARHKRAGALLAADIRRRGGLLSTGFLGTPLALDALASVGEHELAWDLLLRRDYPSWGYMVEHGATTIWERWNGDTGDVAMNSFNHYALGAVCGFLYRRVAGIAPTAPGFASFEVAPVTDARIASAGATLDTVRGRIETRWSRKGAAASLELTVPANTQALVRLPEGHRTVGPGQHHFTL